MKTSSTHNSAGFSMTELIVVLVIIGIVIAIGLPGINRARTEAEVESWRAKAVALQNAKSSAINALGLEAAQASWAGATDNSRYISMLKPNLPDNYPTYLNSTNDNTSLFPTGSGYSIYLDGGADIISDNNISSTVVLSGPYYDSNGTYTNGLIPLMKY